MSQHDTTWLNMPWMYSKPKGEEALSKWREKWVTYFLDYAEEKNIYEVNVSDLKRQIPFNKMDRESFSHVIDILVSTNRAKWRSRQGLLAICWRSLDKWAELAVQAAKEKGKTVINGVDGLKDVCPKTSCLPQEELEQTLKIIVDKSQGRLIDKKTLAVRLL